MLQIEVRTGRSFSTRLLQIVLRNFKWLLSKPQSEHPAGSPRLKVPSAASKNCTVTERNVDDTWLYDFVPKDQETAERAKKRRIYYFCGGGFRKTPIIQHWQFVHELAIAVPANVTVISYPLAPHSPAKDSIPHLVKLYYTIMQESKEKNEEITFMGDSAAPAADCRVINPEIRDIEPYDPFLTYPYIQEVAGLWAKGLDRSDPMVTPLLADFTPLKERGVVVDGIYGTWDLLAPDDRLLAEKLRDDGLEGSWMAYEGQIHCFPLTWPYGMPEAVASKDWIVARCQSSNA